jgi:hypothetical protein
LASEVRLPDFIIGGAPKCATTSLHYILAEHEEIGIPRAELHFFDADDPITHPDFFFTHRGHLVTFDCEAPSGSFFAGYAEHFRPFLDTPYVGEDSTTYIFSEVAPARIKKMLPGVKLIFMLRDPVARAYSQYWHLVNSGRAVVSFERALTAHPSIVLGSTYLRHLGRYFELFGRDRIQVLLFEDFIRDPIITVDSVTDFIGARRFGCADSTLWSNRTHYPAFPSLQIILNRLRRPIIQKRYRSHLTTHPQRYGFGVLGNKVLRRLAGRSARRPAMRPTTREFLARHLSERNRGLSDLLNRDLPRVWEGFTG